MYEALLTTTTPLVWGVRDTAQRLHCCYTAVGFLGYRLLIAYTAVCLLLCAYSTVVVLSELTHGVKNVVKCEKGDRYVPHVYNGQKRVAFCLQSLCQKFRQKKTCLQRPCRRFKWEHWL